MMTYNKQLLIAATAALALWAGGCSVADMAVTSAGATLPAEEGSAEFLDRLASQENVSENDALRGVLLLTDGSDPAENFEQRVRMLRDRGVLPSGWTHQADRPVTRGRMAYMLYQAMNLDGGVMLTLTGPTQRYCLRELQYRGFIAPGAMYNPVGGMEYVAVLTRADAYMETGEVPGVLATSRN